MRTPVATAPLLNILLPGLGFLYLRRWRLAVRNVLLWFGISAVGGLLVPLDAQPMGALPFTFLVLYLSGRWAMHEAIRMGLPPEPETGAPGAASPPR